MGPDSLDICIGYIGSDALACIGLLVFTRRWKESWLRPSLPAVTVKAEGLRLMIDALRI